MITYDVTLKVKWQIKGVSSSVALTTSKVVKHLTIGIFNWMGSKVLCCAPGLVLDRKHWPLTVL